MASLKRGYCGLRREIALVPILGLSLFVASGCAMLGGAGPEPEFVTVAVVTKGQSDVDLEADSTTDSALVGGGAGAVTAGAVGAGTGAAMGAVTGPFAVVLVPAGAAFFGAIGLAAGGTTGAIIGGLQGLPKEKAEQVTLVLMNFALNRNFQGELRTAVENALPEARRAPSGRADATAALQLSEIELEQHLSDVISVHMEATMTLTSHPMNQATRSRSFDYVYDTPERHVDEWLSEDADAFDAAFAEGIEDLARRMLRDIEATGAR